MTKRIKNLIGAIFFGGLLIAVTIRFITQYINVDLSKVNQITGPVKQSGVSETSTSGRRRLKGKVFFITLYNSIETFATYRPSQEYSKLVNTIKPGDIITIYYNHSNSNEYNLDVYQIVKQGQIIQDYESYNSNYKTIAWLTGIGGLGILIAGLYPFLKKAKDKK